MIATPTEIQYFIEIYQTQHVSKAALRLGVTQPTLTQSLKSLESKLKVDLFVRTKQGVIPTEQGQLFYKRAFALLDSWRTVGQRLQESLNQVRGHFTVGCHQSVGSYTIPPFLKNLSAHAPQIEIDLHHDFSRKITEGVVSYKLDLGFVINPVRHPDLIVKKLGNDRVTFWKKRGLNHPPKRILADTSLDQIEKVLGKSYKSHFGDWSLLHSTSMELIRTLALSGEGVAVLPERIALADGADLIPFDRRLPAITDEIYLIYRREVLQSQAGKVLLKLAQINL